MENDTVTNGTAFEQTLPRPFPHARVRGNFGEKFASQGREDKIKRVWYFWPLEANSSSCVAIGRIELSSVNQASNKIHGILTRHHGGK